MIVTVAIARVPTGFVVARADLRYPELATEDFDKAIAHVRKAIMHDAGEGPPDPLPEITPPDAKYDLAQIHLLPALGKLAGPRIEVRLLHYERADIETSLVIEVEHGPDCALAALKAYRHAIRLRDLGVVADVEDLAEIIERAESAIDAERADL